MNAARKHGGNTGPANDLPKDLKGSTGVLLQRSFRTKAKVSPKPPKCKGVPVPNNIETAFLPEALLGVSDCGIWGWRGQWRSPMILRMDSRNYRNKMEQRPPPGWTRKACYSQPTPACDKVRCRAVGGHIGL